MIPISDIEAARQRIASIARVTPLMPCERAHAICRRQV